MKKILLLLFCLFIGCEKEQKTNYQLVNVSGREEVLNPIYLFKPPLSWKVTLNQKDIKNTMNALAEFIVEEGNESIRITFHNFPTDQIEQRIPVASQLHRWKGQFQSLEERTLNIKNESFAGFHGLSIKVDGVLDNKDIRLIGFALTLSSEHYRTFLYAPTRKLQKKYKDIRADVTIKVLGSRSLVEKHENEIVNFIKSFQLIDDIE